eukprot:COSAG01_NODE_69_length_28801_cov_10.460038_1_plen_141_part_10
MINTLSNSDITQFKDQLHINAIAPIALTYAFLKHLDEGSKIIMITSRMGSITDNESGSRYGYRMSKAALNAASKSLAIDLKDEGISVGIFHPGWVKTDMTGNTGHLSAKDSAKLLIQRIHELNLNNSGVFKHANGDILPW